MSRKIELEYELKTRSGSAVWTLISTPIGMMKWLADEVTLEGETATFVWGDPLREHDTHTATVIEMVKNSHIRLHWDSSDSEAYWEIRMFHSEIAGNYHLAVTDFTEDDEPEDLVRIWDQNIERLHRITGV
ncbi:MAG: START-like domain-containing protein [Prevotella denticola]|uniref:START-like domain-containing protein n=1 Tax=Prevotella denticola TaxID=28129 RepID=UPI003FA0B05C